MSTHDTDELIAMLDKLVSDGVGHINIATQEGSADSISVSTVNSTECSCKTGACCQPTEQIDEEDE
ncbi:MAG: hypothetical protein R3Y23_03065 [Bacillota bacterium]